MFLDEEAFKLAISLERKRSERTNRLFVLMLLDFGSAKETLEKSTRLLAETIRETDVMGWHEKNTVLGIVFTDIPDEYRGSIVSAISFRVHGLLYRGLTFEEFGQVSISSHLFPEAWNHEAPQRPSSPVLYPDVAKREKNTQLFSIVKRAIDIAGSSLGLLVASPLLFLIALMIKLSSKGPVLFRQVRVGQYGKPFTFLKFRSMYSDNDASVHRDYVRALIRGRADREPCDGKKEGVYKLTSDRRVTRIGALLRRTSLDELPQLYNVLKGEMSLVGPRPAIPYEVEAYEAWHRRRVLEAKPGITGLWQVKGRSRVTFDEMVRLDVRYATACSLWLDLKILMATPGAVLFGAGAW